MLNPFPRALTEGLSLLYTTAPLIFAAGTAFIRGLSLAEDVFEEIKIRICAISPVCWCSAS